MDGAPLWRVASDVSTYPFKGVLVTGTTILGITHSGGVKAYSVTDGSPLWGGIEAAAPTDFYSTSLSTDGTLAYTVTACELYAIRVSNGTIAWHTPVSADPGGVCGFLDYAPAPIVVDGVVYASDSLGDGSAANATTGAPLTADRRRRLRRPRRRGRGVDVQQLRLQPVRASTPSAARCSGATPRSVGSAAWRCRVTSSSCRRATAAMLGVDRVAGEKVWDGALERAD